MSSLLTLSVQRPSESNNNVVIVNNSNNNTLNVPSSSSSSTSGTLISPVPTSTTTSPCVTPAPQTPAVCAPLPTALTTRNGRKRPALPTLQLDGVVEHRRRENDARLRDTRAVIEASFLAEAPSSPGAYSISSDSSQPSGSDSDDSQNSNSALCSSAKFEKRIRFDSNTSSIYNNTVSVDTLESDGSQSVKTAGVHDIPDVLGADEYIAFGGGDDFQVLEKTTQELFQAIKLDAEKYKKFMKIAGRIESARKNFAPDVFKRLKSRIIPSDTRIVPGSKGISYLLMPSHHTSLSMKLKDPKNPRERVKLSEKEVQSLVNQIVEMMELCHQVGLFFGDFKFEKFVFVDSQKTIIRPRSPLIFHLSKEVNDDTLFGIKVGYAFMAPEMLNRRQTSYSGVAADMWALGVFTFYLLSGNYPFTANEPHTLFTRIRSRNITSKIEDFASTEARVMVFCLFCKNPAERPSAQRLKQCHWLKMTPEELSAPRYSHRSLYECGTRNNLNLLAVQIEQVRQTIAQTQQRISQFPRVSSDRRLNRFMEHRQALFNRFNSDQVVPAPATAHVLLPTNNSSRVCIFASAEGRRC